MFKGKCFRNLISAFKTLPLVNTIDDRYACVGSMIVLSYI